MAKPRKPIEAKILTGTFRPDKDGPLEAQVRAGGVPEPLPDLSDEARDFWDRVVPGLVERGCAAACDSPMLSAMCEWWARYQRYGDALDKLTPSCGTAAMVSQAGLCMMNFDKIASRFGLTPSDRAKLKISPMKAPSKVDARKRG